METTNFGFVASLLFVGVPTIFLIGLFISTQDGEKSSFYSDSSKELVMKENLQLYGLKGILGNCGGAGQCSTCFISVEGGNKNSLSPLTSVEEEKLKNRPENWRLACQTLIKSSAVILTKPQSPPSNLEELKKISENKKLPR